MDTLYDLVRWMAESVANGEWKNQFLDSLLQYDKTYDLLREVGRAIVQMFN